MNTQGNQPEILQPSERLVETARQLSLSGRALRRLVAERIQHLQLNDTHFLVLMACRRGAGPGGVSQNELAHQVGVSAAQLSSVIEQLHHRGLVEPRRCDLDRRRQLWQITAAGRTRVNEALRLVLPIAERLRRDWTTDDLQRLQQLLSQLELDDCGTEKAA